MPHVLDSDPFSDINSMPLAAYTDPDGFARLQLMQNPNAKTFRRLCPNAARLADGLYQHLSRTTWGIQGLRGDSGWSKFLAGQEVTLRSGRRFARKRLEVNDVLASLCRRDRYAVGTEDKSSTSVRLDIDCGYVVSSEDFTALAEIERACQSAGAGLGLKCFVRTTGGGGVAADYPLPERMDAEDAIQVTDAVRAILEPLLPKGAKLDVDGCRSLMRLPLMRNAKTGRLGLYVEQGQVLPLPEQLLRAVSAVTPTGGDAAELLAAAAEVLDASQGANGREALARRPEEAVPRQNLARGARHARWEGVRAQRPEPGAFYQWIRSDDRVYAFFWLHGKEGARAVLHGIADEVWCSNAEELRKRHRLVDDMVDSFVMFSSTGAAGHEELCEEDELAANAMVHDLVLSGCRKDAVRSVWMVARAYYHARRLYGRADGADTHRMCERLYGVGVVSRATAFRSLPPTNIAVSFRQDLIAGGGYVMPECFAEPETPAEEPRAQEAYEELDEAVVWDTTGHSDGSKAAIGQSMEAGQRFHPRKRSSPSARPSQSVQPARSTSRQSLSLPDGDSCATARTYAVFACT